MGKTMDIIPQLQTINKTTLISPVRRALHNDTLEVLDWQSRQLGGGFGNPVSLSFLYRITEARPCRGPSC